MNHFVPFNTRIFIWINAQYHFIADLYFFYMIYLFIPVISYITLAFNQCVVLNIIEFI